MSESTQQVGISFSSLQSLLPRPQLIIGFLRDYLSRHFQEGHIESPELQKLIWGNHERTDILIESSTRWLPESTGRRPAVIIHANDSTNVRHGIANKHEGMTSEGRVRYTTGWSGSSTLFCIGETGAQAAVLANEVQKQLTEYEDQIRRHLCILRFQVMSLGAVAELEEYAQNFVCPVTVAYHYEESWESGPEAPRLSKISISLDNFTDI
jgi:hypothetical protein